MLKKEKKTVIGENLNSLAYQKAHTFIPEKKCSGQKILSLLWWK